MKSIHKRVKIGGYCCFICDGPVKNFKKTRSKRTRNVLKRQAKKEIKEAQEK